MTLELAVETDCASLQDASIEKIEYRTLNVQLAKLLLEPLVELLLVELRLLLKLQLQLPILLLQLGHSLL